MIHDSVSFMLIKDKTFEIGRFIVHIKRFLILKFTLSMARSSAEKQPSVPSVGHIIGKDLLQDVATAR